MVSALDTSVVLGSSSRTIRSWQPRFELRVSETNSAKAVFYRHEETRNLTTQKKTLKNYRSGGVFWRCEDLSVSS